MHVNKEFLDVVRSLRMCIHDTADNRAILEAHGIPHPVGFINTGTPFLKLATDDKPRFVLCKGIYHCVLPQDLVEPFISYLMLQSPALFELIQITHIPMYSSKVHADDA